MAVNVLMGYNIHTYFRVMSQAGDKSIFSLKKGKEAKNTIMLSYKNKYEYFSVLNKNVLTLEV